MAEENRNAGYDGTDNGESGNGKGKRNGMDNLIPFDMRTEAEQRAIATAGGKASGEARRRKRDMRAIAKAILEHEMEEEQIREILGTAQTLIDDDKSTAAVLTARMVQEAAGGNFKAYEVLRDTAGYKPKDQLEIDAPMTDADREMLERVSKRLETGLHNDSKQAL